MSTREVLLSIENIEQPANFNINIIQMLSSFAISISQLFTGSQGAACFSDPVYPETVKSIKVPSLQKLQAFEHSNNQWIIAYLQLCEGVLKLEQNQENFFGRITVFKSTNKQQFPFSRALSPLLDHVFQRKMQWIRKDKNLAMNHIEAKLN